MIEGFVEILIIGIITISMFKIFRHFKSKKTKKENQLEFIYPSKLPNYFKLEDIPDVDVVKNVLDM